MKLSKKSKILTLSIFMFYLGYEAANNDFFPVTHFYERHFVAEKEPIFEPESVATLNQLKYSIYADTTQKQRVSCPDPDKVFVVAIFGQSNAANNAGHRFANDDERLINFFNGACYVASDPVLGAAGKAGSVWVPFLQNLDVDKTILMINFAIGASSISHWLSPESLGPLMSENMYNLAQSGYSPDLFLLVQGEADSLTDEKAYENKLQTLVSKIKTDHPFAKMGISSTSYCGKFSNEKITDSQRRVALFQNLIWLGNTDKFNGLEHRYDGCHFSGQGALEAAAMFSQAVNDSLTD